jgi:hypothetical protein
MKRFALSLLMLSLTACGEHVVVTSVDTFCTRVERYHATDDERAALKANSGPLERFIRWAAGINAQYDKHCLKPSGTS